MATSPEDATPWLGAARAGSIEALGHALESCRETLQGIAQQGLDDPRLRAKGGASDLVQHTFLEAQRDFRRFHGLTGSELLKWLRRLLLNNLANFRRLYREEKRRVNREVRLNVDSSTFGRADLVPSKVPSPSTEAVLKEQSQKLAQALAGLPKEYRQVIRLRYQQQCSFAEIAQVLGRTVNGSQKLWMRATQRLRAEFEKQA